MATIVLDPPDIKLEDPQPQEQEPARIQSQTGFRPVFLLVVTVLSVLVNGYHPYSEDAAIYVQVIKKKLDPSLYLHSAEFLLPHARFSLFPSCVALSVALAHVRVDYGLLLWHLFTIGLLLAGCWRFCQLCFDSKHAPIYGTLLTASALTLPIAGTSLFLCDPYLTSRSLSTPALLFAICYVLEKKLVRAFLWFVCALLVHPLMAAYGGVFLLLLLLRIERRSQFVLLLGLASAAVIFAARDYAKGVYITSNYRAAVLTRSYFFLSQWHWYEIFGLFAPLGLFVWLWWSHKRSIHSRMQQCLTATLWYGLFFLIIGFALIRTADLIAIARFQPMRSFHLIYILLLLLPVNFGVQRLFEGRPVRFALLLVAVCGAMFLADRQSFPASSHLEWPWARSDNDWRQAFDWVRSNTPKNAVFALSPNYMNQAGEDNVGFRAYAERSSLADRNKDGGVAAIFPPLADAWVEENTTTAAVDQVQNDLQAAPLARAGVSWVVVHDAPGMDLECPYRNHTLAVCRLQQFSVFATKDRPTNHN